MLTAPAPGSARRDRLDRREAIYNFRDSLNYLRTTPDGRIAFGRAGSSRGSLAGSGRGSTTTSDSSRGGGATLADVPEPSGRAARGRVGRPGRRQRIHLPFFGTLPSGSVHYGFGYTGNGVAPSHLGGQILASLALGSDDEFTRCRLRTPSPNGSRPSRSAPPACWSRTPRSRRKDEAEDAGGRAGLMTEFFARLPRRLGYRLGP